MNSSQRPMWMGFWFADELGDEKDVFDGGGFDLISLGAVGVGRYDRGCRGSVMEGQKGGGGQLPGHDAGPKMCSDA